MRLFNLHALTYANTTLALCEGEMDAISLTALGVPTVGIPGANSWKPWHWRCLEGFERVVVFHDDDDAGKGLLKKVLTDVPQAVPAAPPGGFNDVNEALVAGLGDEVRRIVFGKDTP